MAYGYTYAGTIFNVMVNICVPLRFVVDLLPSLIQHQSLRHLSLNLSHQLLRAATTKDISCVTNPFYCVYLTPYLTWHESSVRKLLIFFYSQSCITRHHCDQCVLWNSVCVITQGVSVPVSKCVIVSSFPSCGRSQAGYA